MRLGFGKADAVKPRQQTNKMLVTVLAADLRNVLAISGFYYPRKVESDITTGKKLNEPVLKLKKLEDFF